MKNVDEKLVPIPKLVVEMICFSSKSNFVFQDLSYKDRHWHERCFFCSMCKTPLVDKPFGCKNDELFCGECYNQQFASRCDKCNQIFKPGKDKEKFFNLKKKQKNSFH